MGLTFPEDKDIIINLKDLISMNSISIISCLNLFYPLKQKIRYEEAPSCFIEQINIIVEFLAHAHVDSIYLPYYCPLCDNIEYILFQTPQSYELLQEKLPKEYICKKYKTTREADFESESFFFFLKQKNSN